MSGKKNRNEKKSHVLLLPGIKNKITKRLIPNPLGDYKLKSAKIESC